ncbi:MAG: LysM peptidoglycan-binding domain-containing protein [Bacilli bacterium]|nr:LysM peptidoglycan-binding domain-containing protein [Bacilli bacterium]
MHEIVSFSKEIEFKNMINKITSISLEHTLMLENGFNIRGDFIVSGTYKMTAATRLENDFSYKIPVDIEVDDKYDLSNLIIDIDNFTYEVLDEEVLKVNIDLLLDKLELKKEEQVRKIETLEDEVVNAEDLFLEIDDKKDLTILNDDDIEILDVEQAKKENMRDEDNYDDEVEDTFKKIEEQKEAEEINLNNINVEEQTSESNKKSLETENSPSLFATFDTSQETYSTYTVYIVRENDSLDEIMNKYKISKEKLEEYNNLNEIKIGTKLIIPNIKDE